MSLEQAILELASAMRELAKANSPQVRVTAEKISELSGEDRAVLKGTTVADATADEIPGKKSRDSVVKPDAELEKAVSKVEEAAGAEQKELTYTADVLPLLMKLNKTKGKDALVALLGHFEAAKGDKIKPEQFADVIAYAEEKLAA